MWMWIECWTTLPYVKISNALYRWTTLPYVKIAVSSHFIIRSMCQLICVRCDWVYLLRLLRNSLPTPHAIVGPGHAEILSSCKKLRCTV